MRQTVNLRVLGSNPRVGAFIKIKYIIKILKLKKKNYKHTWQMGMLKVECVSNFQVGLVIDKKQVRKISKFEIAWPMWNPDVSLDESPY